jgi:CheY-like chemotaxis protein
MQSAMTRLPPHRTVLLVEDDDDIAETLAELLCEVGRQVVMAKDGEQALEKLKAIEPPCLILLDLLMPRMDGFQFLERLKEHPHSAEFSVLVTSAHDRLTEAAQYAGVVGALRKPFELEELLARIAEDD